MCIIKLVARPLLLHRLFPLFLLNSFLAFMEFFSSSLILQAMRAISLLLLTINPAIASVSLSHKLGYCNTYGNCGKSRCLANHYHVPSLSLQGKSESREKLKSICGKDFDYICCSPEQIDILELNLKRVDPLISSCPACRKNFYDFSANLVVHPMNPNLLKSSKLKLLEIQAKK